MNTEYQATLVEKTFPHKPQCPNHHNTWSDCGKGGITPEACRAKGCCWDTTSPRAFCYHKGKLERPTMSW